MSSRFSRSCCACLAAMRSRDPVGRRKSAGMRARGKDQRFLVLPSLLVRGVRRHATRLRIIAGPRRAGARRAPPDAVVPSSRSTFRAGAGPGEQLRMAAASWRALSACRGGETRSIVACGGSGRSRRARKTAATRGPANGENRSIVSLPESTTSATVCGTVRCRSKTRRRG